MSNARGPSYACMSMLISPHYYPPSCPWLPLRGSPYTHSALVVTHLFTFDSSLLSYMFLLTRYYPLIVVGWGDGLTTITTTTTSRLSFIGYRFPSMKISAHNPLTSLASGIFPSNYSREVRACLAWNPCCKPTGHSGSARVGLHTTWNPLEASP